MNTIYFVLKFLHVVAASIWIGGLIATSALDMRLARAIDPRILAVTTRQSGRVGMMLLLPAAVTTLLAGAGSMAISGIGFAAWIVWGLVAIVLSVALGASVVRRSVAALIERLETAPARDAGVASLQRRVAILNAALVAILLSAVWAMVFKPTL
ncbi:MAG TPA: DUF2269 family protein [Gammaproteobacteria bacterium]|nr:DUF2269 family protein [Gammaproteobacteria bacterium]